MIRRVVLAGGLVLATVLTACSSSTSPTSKVVASVDGQELSADELEALLATDATSGSTPTSESAPTQPPTTVAGSGADGTRTIIRQWILMAATGHDMSAITDAASLQAEAQLAAEELATPYLGDAETAYAKGWDSSPAVCLAAIFPSADVDPQSIVTEIEGGLAFADAVTKYSQDATTKATRGAVALDLGNGTPQPCYPTTSLNAALADPMKGAVPGELRVVQGSASQVVVEIRPFEDLSAGEKVSIVPELSQKIGEEYTKRLQGAKIFVDPRYGRWDSATSTVVALNG